MMCKPSVWVLRTLATSVVPISGSDRLISVISVFFCLIGSVIGSANLDPDRLDRLILIELLSQKNGRILALN